LNHEHIWFSISDFWEDTFFSWRFIFNSEFLFQSLGIKFKNIHWKKMIFTFEEFGKVENHIKQLEYETEERNKSQICRKSNRTKVIFELCFSSISIILQKSTIFGKLRNIPNFS